MIIRKNLLGNEEIVQRTQEGTLTKIRDEFLLLYTQAMVNGFSHPDLSGSFAITED